jgi:hypothetical protein
MKDDTKAAHQVTINESPSARSQETQIPAMKVAENETKHKHTREGEQHSAGKMKINSIRTHTKHQAFFLFTCSEGSMGPSSTK